MSNTNTESKGMVTLIHVYDTVGINCPSDMTIENCPLRQELAKLPKYEHLKYDTLPNGDLMVPCYLPKKDEKMHDLGCIHVNSLCTRICQECRNKQR